MRQLGVVALVLTALVSCVAAPTQSADEPPIVPGIGVRRAGATVAPAPAQSGPACGAGRVLCGATCVQFRNDPVNCGGCGFVCPTYNYSTAACQNGTCAFGACIAGYADCDGDFTNGCETSTSTDAANCGACGHVCRAGALCVAGVCSTRGCGAGTGNCDGDARNGCETNTDFDSLNCGACGTVCPAGQMCVDGACKVSSCDVSTEVELAGHCYYLDGSGGACDAGYQLASQSALSQGMFAGKTYKHQVSDNCCIFTSDVAENWGMGDHCNVPGPFTANDPQLGAIGCTNVTQLFPAQLTLCFR